MHGFNTTISYEILTTAGPYHLLRTQNTNLEQHQQQLGTYHFVFEVRLKRFR